VQFYFVSKFSFSKIIPEIRELRTLSPSIAMANIIILVIVICNPAMMRLQHAIVTLNIIKTKYKYRVVQTFLNWPHGMSGIYPDSVKKIHRWVWNAWKK
jgi:hypothetical protein